MPSSAVIEYATEGGPLIIGDVEHVQHWTGSHDNGSGIRVVYGGIGLEKFPKALAQTTKVGGKREKKFKTADEASAFEAEVLKRFLARHPGARRPSRYPDYSRWYVGTEENGVFPADQGVFWIERFFTSDYSAMTRKLKTELAELRFSRKHAATALFAALEGSGPGEIARSGDALVIARVVTTDGEPKGLVESLAKVTRPKALGTTQLSGNVVVFHAALSGADVSRATWKTASLVDGFAGTSGSLGPLQAPDQSKPGGAFARIEPGAYSYGVSRDHEVAGSSFDALWLWTK